MADPSSQPELLKVGELAVRSGLTVRTLHHFDQIGLLRPSARSAAGYRLYDRDDVARLHGILALRRLGLPLKDIGSMLSGDGADLPLLLARQLQVLDREIAQANELRTQLSLLADRFAAGDQPAMGEWLVSLELMATYARYFSAAEVRRIVANWQQVRDEWPLLVDEVRQMRARGVPADSLELQPLAQRWMGLIHAWLGGDFELIERWGRMYRQEPVTRQRDGPDLDTVQYIEPACQRRMACWLNHFTLDEMRRFQWVPTSEWRLLEAQARQLRDRGVPLVDPAWKGLRRRWQALADRVAGNDPALRQRIDAAYAADPMLQAGLSLPPELRAGLLPATLVASGKKRRPGA